MADQELFEAWFRTADRSGTGALAGRDAVAFFGRAGLSQATLFQVCERRMEGREKRESVGKTERKKRGRARCPHSLLPPTLAPLQIWQVVAGDAPAMTKPQFYSALRLVSLAQV